MTVDEFKAQFPGVVISVYEGGEVKWYHFRHEKELQNYVCTMLLIELTRFLKKKKDPNADDSELNQDDEYPELDPEDEDSGSRSGTYIQVLQNDSETIMVIDSNNLEEVEWQRLQQESAWTNAQAFSYWKKITGGYDFKTLVEKLGLEQYVVIELFGITGKIYANWFQNKAPLAIIIRMIEIDETIDRHVEEWLSYFLDLKKRIFQEDKVLGMPAYTESQDYYICDSPVSQELPILELYQTFSERLIQRLAIEKIEVKLVEMIYEDFCEWLDQNDYPSVPSARITFATLQLKNSKQKPNRKA